MNYKDDEKIIDERIRQSLRAANSAKKRYAQRAEEAREQLRHNNYVDEKEVISTKKGSNKVLMVSAIISLSIATIATLGYFQTKEKMKGTIIDPRTGYTYTPEDSIEPSFDEVIEEMFKGNGK